MQYASVLPVRDQASEIEQKLVESDSVRLQLLVYPCLILTLLL